MSERIYPGFFKDCETPHLMLDEATEIIMTPDGYLRRLAHPDAHDEWFYTGLDPVQKALFNLDFGAFPHCKRVHPSIISLSYLLEVASSRGEAFKCLYYTNDRTGGVTDFFHSMFMPFDLNLAMSSITSLNDYPIGIRMGEDRAVFILTTLRNRTFGEIALTTQEVILRRYDIMLHRNESVYIGFPPYEIINDKFERIMDMDKRKYLRYMWRRLCIAIMGLSDIYFDKQFMAPTPIMDKYGDYLPTKPVEGQEIIHCRVHSMMDIFNSIDAIYTPADGVMGDATYNS